MIYSKNLKKSAIIKRIFLSWLVVAVVSAIIAGVAGFLIGMKIYGQENIEPVEPVPTVERTIILPIPFCIPPLDIETSTETGSVEVEEAEPEFTSLGVYKLTAYCACKKCCGENAKGITASGTQVTAGRTIATDPKVIPTGTQVFINGQEYTAEDTGSGVNGNHIDIYMNSHQQALDFGIQYAEVLIRR